MHGNERAAAAATTTSTTIVVTNVNKQSKARRVKGCEENTKRWKECGSSCSDAECM